MTGKSFTANARGLAWVCTTAACLLSAAGARGEESPDQRLAEALLQAHSQVAAAQPRQARQRVTTNNCAWFGNALNCTAVR